MAHLVAGIDIGSHSIKFVCIEAGFRRSKVKEIFEERVPEGDEPLEQRQDIALRAGAQRLGSDVSVFVTVPGDRVSIRLLDMPFLDPRKVDQVVPYELEGQIVQPLEEVVFSHVILDEPLGEAPVLAAASRIEDVGRWLERLTAAGVQARALYPAPSVYRALEGHIGVEIFPDEATSPGVDLEAITDAVTREGPNPLEEGKTVAGTPAPASLQTGKTTIDAKQLRLLVDVGHTRTNIVVLYHGVPVFARTVMRGGQQLTAAIAAAFGADAARAEEAKHNRAVVAHPGYRPVDPIDEKLSQLARQSFEPLVQDIRQTIASFRARCSVAPTGFSLVGGGARLRGLREALIADLDLPSIPFEPVRGGLEPADDIISSDERFVLAEAAAWSGVLGTKQIDLRRGPFVYRASFSVLRQKAAHFAVLGAILVVCVVVDARMAYSRLHQQQLRLERDLEEATTELFGAPDKNAQKVARLLRQGFREEMPPIPRATAFDILNEFSRRLPKIDAIKVDVLEFDIRPKKTFMKGVIDSVASVDKVVEALKEFDCVEDVTKGAITEVAGGEKQFALTFKSKCP